MKRRLKGGRVVDPANRIDGVHDVLIEDGRIAAVGRDLPVDGAEVVLLRRVHVLFTTLGLVGLHPVNKLLGSFLFRCRRHALNSKPAIIQGDGHCPRVVGCPN